MIWPGVALFLLAQSPGPVSPDAPLPPGHPALNSSPPGGKLPPGHPPLNSAAPGNGTLPPGHPALGNSGGTPESSPEFPPFAGASAESPAAAPATLPAGHPHVNRNEKPMSAGDLIKKLDSTTDLRQREKTFEVAAALGKLYYGSARYLEAAIYLRQALEKTASARASYLDLNRKAGTQALPTPAEAGCLPGPEATVDSLAQMARQKAQEGNASAAAECARLAIEPVVDAERTLADALFLTGDAKGALAELDRAAALDDRDPEVVFLRGAVRLDSSGDDVKALRAAKQDFDKVLVLAPQGPRAPFARLLGERAGKAIGAGGLAKLDALEAKEDKAKPPPRLAAPVAPFAGSAAPFAGTAPPFAGGGQGVPALTKEQMEAVQNTERTPELMQGMQKLVEEGEDDLAHGKFQDALDAYKRVVPFQPENGRAKAGMAWALVGLGKPMADRVWMVAVQADPAAVDKLGDALKAKGDAQGAQALWQKLASSDPTYADRAGLKQKL
jgi:tetratricopeptide (TPR) repeat protein